MSTLPSGGAHRSLHQAVLQVTNGQISEADLDRDMSFPRIAQPGASHKSTLRSLITLLENIDNKPLPVTGVGAGSTLDWIRWEAKMQLQDGVRQLSGGRSQERTLDVLLESWTEDRSE